MNDLPHSETELLAWIAAGTEEGHTIEYKRAASLGADSQRKMEIAKDVSAMANSAGGLLFYGVAEDKHLPTGLDPLVDPKITKEWLEQVINTGIHPRILDLHIHPVRVTQPVAGVVYVVEIPEGATAHQAVGYEKYYRRFNFESVPMHDREIRDVMGRSRDPVVEVTASIEVAPMAHFMGHRSSDENYRWLKLGLENVGRKMAHEVRAFIHIPLALLHEPRKMIPVPEVKETKRGPMAVVRISNRSVEGDGPLPRPVSIDGPLLPGLILPVQTVCLISTKTPLPAESLMVIQVYADDAQVRTRALDLRELEESDEQATDES